MTDSSRILFVDDDRDSCEMMSLMLNLTDESLEVISAGTAEDALSLMSTQKFDLFILDYRLPDLTGVELCGRIRHFDSQTPIMFYSAMSGQIDRETARAAGADEYLIKPNDLHCLTQKVKQLLSASER